MLQCPIYSILFGISSCFVADYVGFDYVRLVFFLFSKSQKHLLEQNDIVLNIGRIKEWSKPPAIFKFY